jgi:hypothetical protein
MIQYVSLFPSPNIEVRVNGMKVGTIKKVEDGWQYFPHGVRKSYADVLKTLEELQSFGTLM